MSSAHRYLDVLDRVAEAHAKAKSAKSAKSDLRGRAQNSQNSQNSRAQKLGSVLVALESRRPDLVPVDRWQQAVADGKTFLSRWGDQAQALGWTGRDLFGLLTVPGHAKPSFNRLSRYDETGLVWPLAARAQQPAGQPLVGLLSPLSATAAGRNIAAFRQGMRDLGYLEGRNVAFALRFAEGDVTRLPALAHCSG
jgi:hypothetical protein